MIRQTMYVFICFSMLSLNALDDSHHAWDREGDQRIDADKPLRKVFKQLMYAGALNVFKERKPLMEDLSYASVQRLLMSCRSRAGAIELMLEHFSLLPDLVSAIDELYARSPTLQQVQSKDAYASRKIKESNDEAQKTLWGIIKEIGDFSLHRITKIKQAADLAGRPCDADYLNEMLQQLYAVEPHLESEYNLYEDVIDDNQEFIAQRIGHPYVKPLDHSLIASRQPTLEDEAAYKEAARIVAQRVISDNTVFKMQLKELAELNVSSVYQLLDVVRGCQYGNRVLAAYDQTLLRSALEVKREIDDMVPYAAIDECCTVDGKLHQPIKELIAVHNELERLSSHRAWKYIFCAEKVIARMQEPADRADRIQADWQQLHTFEYAIADELLLWHPVHTQQGSDCETGFSVTMERMEESEYELRVLGYTVKKDNQ